MISDPRTLDEAKTIRYGRWGSNSAGYPYNPAHCASEVYHRFGGYVSSQCSRKNGHGPDGLYCKQHSKKLFYTIVKEGVL